MDKIIRLEDNKISLQTIIPEKIDSQEIDLSALAVQISQCDDRIAFKQKEIKDIENNKVLLQKVYDSAIALEVNQEAILDKDSDTYVVVETPKEEEIIK